MAFIMDGNRRYATKNGMEKLQGHALGFNKLSEVNIYVFYLLNCLEVDGGSYESLCLEPTLATFI